jgi:hypothetical protein
LSHTSGPRSRADVRRAVPQTVRTPRDAGGVRGVDVSAFGSAGRGSLTPERARTAANVLSFGRLYGYPHAIRGCVWGGNGDPYLDHSPFPDCSRQTTAGVMPPVSRSIPRSTFGPVTTLQGVPHRAIRPRWGGATPSPAVPETRCGTAAAASRAVLLMPGWASTTVHYRASPSQHRQAVDQIEGSRRSTSSITVPRGRSLPPEPEVPSSES